MKYEISLSDALSEIIDNKANLFGLSSSRYIVSILEECFKNEINSNFSYIATYQQLRNEIEAFLSTIQTGTTFTLRDVPFYRNIAVSEISNNQQTLIPSGIRARLGRSFNDEVKRGGWPSVERHYTKNGNLAFSKAGGSNSAVYIKK